MKLSKKIILLLTVCFANYFSYSQSAKNVGIENNYQRIPWDMDQGLSEGQITSMLKDSYGFLWIGTSVALNRFDGSHFINYFPDKNKSGTINSGNINHLIQDSLGNIWIGTSMGLSRYDNRADTFSNFLSPVDPALTFAFIIPFWATYDEVFCIETSSRITAYNIHSYKKRIVVNHFIGNLGNQFFKYGYSIMDARTNRVWMLDKGGLLEVNLISGKQIHYAPEKVIKDDDYILAMCYDPARKLIWLTTKDGLVQFSLNDKKFIHLDAFKDILKQTHYWPLPGISLDPQGRIWLITVSNGILIFDPADQVVKPFFSTAELRIEGVAGFIYCGPDGMVWTGSSTYNRKSMYQFNPVRPSVIRYVADTANPLALSHKWVASMVRAPQGKLWIGTWDGLDIFDQTTSLFKVLREKDMPGLKGKNIIPVVIDTIRQKAWIKAWPPGAMYEMDIKNRKCRELTIHDTTFNHRLSWDMSAEEVRPFQKGIIFPIGGEGIFSVKKDSLVVYQELFIPQGIERMIVADDRLLFLRLDNAHKNLTYTYLKGKWMLISNPIDSIQWTNIFFNQKDQTFWVGAFKEIIHYDKNFRIILRYTDGFPGVEVLSIIADDHDNIWFANGMGKISRLNPRNGRFITLSEKDGFQKQVFRWDHPTVKDDAGDLYFAGVNGIDRIRPDKLKDSYPPSGVYIQSIEVNQKPVSLATGVNHLNELSLNYDENNINIETGTLDYYSEGSSRIRYKLEGINENWQYGPNGYTLRFDGLPSGKYRLVIQASNAVDDYNGPEKTLLINIHPPFWYTWWFIFLEVIFFVAIVYALFQFRLKQKLKIFNVRQKLHRDLHDDVGATLSSIKVYSEILQTNPQNILITGLIKDNAVEMIDQLEVISWATDPKNDSFRSLNDLMKKYALPACHSKNIELIIQYQGINEDMMMTGSIRQNLFLIFKEAVNNIIKYAEATKCDVQIFIRNQQFFLQIADNGNGFQGVTKGSGSGWKNMRKRAEDLHGKLNMETVNGKGITITVSLPYPFKIPYSWDKEGKDYK